MAGAATGTFFRRGEGMFLRSHYLAAEIASPTVERCSALLFLIRLMCLNGAGFRLGQWCRLGFILPLSVHALSPLFDCAMSQFSPPNWPWFAERAAGRFAK